MRRTDVGRIVLVVGTLAALPAGAAPIDRAAWLAGCWRGGAGGRVIDEHWMAPRGGLMLGMSRTASEVRVGSHEQMRIEADGDTPRVHVEASGKPETRSGRGRATTARSSSRTSPIRIRSGSSTGVRPTDRCSHGSKACAAMRSSAPTSRCDGSPANPASEKASSGPARQAVLGPAP